MINLLLIYVVYIADQVRLTNIPLMKWFVFLQGASEVTSHSANDRVAFRLKQGFNLQEGLRQRRSAGLTHRLLLK